MTRIDPSIIDRRPADALRWEDLDEAGGVLRILRKQVRRHVGPVSRKKRAPKEIPLDAEHIAILREDRQRLMVEQAPARSTIARVAEASWSGAVERVRTQVRTMTRTTPETTTPGRPWTALTGRRRCGLSGAGDGT